MIENNGTLMPNVINDITLNETEYKYSSIIYHGSTTVQMLSTAQLSSTEELPTTGQELNTRQVSSAGQVSTTRQVLSTGQVSNTGEVTSQNEISTFGLISNTEQLSSMGEISTMEQVLNKDQAPSVAQEETKKIENSHSAAYSGRTRQISKNTVPMISKTYILTDFPKFTVSTDYIHSTDKLTYNGGSISKNNLKVINYNQNKINTVQFLTSSMIGQNKVVKHIF